MTPDPAPAFPTSAQAGPASADPSRFRLDADGEPMLVGGRCPDCGCVTWGIRSRCPRCWSTAPMQETALSRRGALYTMTTVLRMPAGYRGPYSVGYVDLPEGVRVFGRILWPAESRWTPGAAVKLVAERIAVDDGTEPLTVPGFRPVGESVRA